MLKEFDYKKLKVYTNDNIYYFDEEKETIIKETNDKIEELGCGKIDIKSTYKKATKTKPASISINVELKADTYKDYEIIPFDKDEEKNKKNIEEFLKKYVSKPYKILDNVVGVEINFNKIFYKPEKLRDIQEILSDIKNLDDELKKLESELQL